MIDQANFKFMLRRIDILGREIEQLRRDLLRSTMAQPTGPTHKLSLFGSVKAGDISPTMVEESQRELFRSLDDL